MICLVESSPSVQPPGNEAPGAAGVFGSWGLTLPGVDVCLTVELSAIAAITPRGPEPVSLDNLREDGRRWHKALRRLVVRDAGYTNPR